MTSKLDLAIIIPVYEDELALESLLINITPQLIANEKIVLVVANTKKTCSQVVNKNKPYTQLAAKHNCILRQAEKGRGMQMAAGVKAQPAKRYLFLHADSLLAENALALLRNTQATWGYFNLYVNNTTLPYRILTWFISRRFHLTHVITGDAGIFVEAALLKKTGGMPLVPLMEDVILTKKLRTIVKPSLINAQIITSARRWEKNGFYKSIVLMWVFRLRFFLGASPQKLAQAYYKPSTVAQRKE